MKKFFAVALCSALFFSGESYAASALTNVNKTNTIRCGYVEYVPALTKDMNTNQWSGFDYDIVQAVANRLQVKADYTTATGWATVVPDLNSKKFDMLCSGFWVHPNVGKFALFSRPAFYQPVFVVARIDDAQFSATTDLNTPDLKMVALDGDNPVAIAQSDFPKAQILTLPNMTDFSQVLVNVADKKADFTIVDAATFGAYDKNNAGKLKIVAPEKPVRVYPVSYVFGSQDSQFRDAFNAALDELILDGTIDKILDKYDTYPNAYYRATVPYRNPYQK
jgi:ABC-type amino acid transport substrate-binding protein